MTNSVDLEALAGISSEEIVQRLQLLLLAKYEGLRALHGDARLYLLEHGFPDRDVAKLFVVVQDCLRRHAIEGGWWSFRPLPLLVAATEIGYAYRGTGTDFWPIFADRLGFTSGVNRGALSDLFRRAAVQMGLAQPADTPWNRAFCHIAWPVLHAILPLELHRPLARALRDVRGGLAVEGDDAALIAPIRARAQLAGGIRLLAWLEDQNTAAAITRYLLKPASPTVFEPAALARIAVDLARDQTALTALQDARKRQSAQTSSSTARGRRSKTEVEFRFAPLVLQSVNQRWSLAVKIPQMDEGPRSIERSALEAIHWRALLWSQGRPVPCRSLFSDFPIPIACDCLPGTETPLLSDLASLPISQDARDFLGSLRVKTTAPLLFGDPAGGDDFIQLLGNSVTEGQSYIVLVTPEQSEPPASAQRLGRVVDMRALRIDAADPESAAWLSQLGIAVRQSARFTWLGAPEVEQHRPARRFLQGNFLAFELSAPNGDCGVRLRDPEGNESSLSANGNLLCGFTPDRRGIYTIFYGTGDAMRFEVVDATDDEPLLVIRADAGTGTIADLSGRGVTLRFDSAATLQEANLELRLLCDGHVVSIARDILPDTPCRVDAEHNIWDELLSADTLERLLVSDTAELVVSVRGLAEECFQFERVMALFEWERSEGKLSAVDDTGELDLFTVTPGEPLRVSAALTAERGSDFVLLRAGHDKPLQAGGLFLGPRILRPAETQTAHRPDRLLRQFDKHRDDAADGHSLVDALIAWSVAGVDHPIAQFRRGQIVVQLGQWLVEQLCGAEWARREAVLQSRRGTQFAEAFLDACVRLGVAFADVTLSSAQRAHLRRILLRLLNSRTPLIGRKLRRKPIDDDLAADLDGVFNDAYADLAYELKSLGEHCPFDPDKDIDVGEASDTWDRVLRAAASQAEFVELVDLLRPLEAGDALSRADFETMLPDDVIDLLTDWIARNRPVHLARSWNRELVEVAYWLFAKPAVAVRLNWRVATQRMLADSFCARAIRYAALRSGVFGEGR